ncbi:MAG: aldo/keto reductase [Prevotellaceae bacterium]|jgi:predicted oxidoreductase|nr:aldo/keto reductase [Prevotellaceae bacterium]
MKYIKLSNTDLSVSNIIMGNMRLNELSKNEAEILIKTALDNGINFFDHADVYGSGECETLFAQAIGMNPTIREKMLLQGKCGIVKKNGFAYFDFSKEYILYATDQILKRLNTEYLDTLLLHRPDSLVEPEEVAEAFDILQKSGKVRHFGVSNQNPSQIRFLQRSVNQKLVANQLQFSVAHSLMVDVGLTVNMTIPQSVSREGGILDYCRENNITIQAWSPLQKGFFEGTFIGDKGKYAKLNETLERIGKKYSVPAATIAIAWITRHPANIQVVTGTISPKHLTEACLASELRLEKEEWYEIYAAAGNMIP